MKVILLRDVAKLGKRFSVVEVPDGYALNQLIPKGIAEAATPINLKRVEARAEKVSHDKADELASFSATVAALKEVTITIAAPANEQQHLFKAVKTSDVAAQLATEGHAVPLSAISLPEPIKTLGEYTLPLEFGGVKGSVKINIISQ
jgi:large subunit ribosomal protein L9